MPSSRSCGARKLLADGEHTTQKRFHNCPAVKHRLAVGCEVHLEIGKCTRARIRTIDIRQPELTVDEQVRLIRAAAHDPSRDP